MGMDTTSRLLPTGPMARRLRVPAKWLKTEAETGRLPHVRAGHVFLFDPDAVDSALLKRAQEGGGHEAW